jgi:hypothetical protein
LQAAPSLLEISWTLKEGDTLIKHQAIGIETLTSDNV